MDTRIEKVTRTFFWIGYAVFLLASIPHIAAYFRHFDPSTPNPLEDGFYWTVAIMIAVVIDVSDVLVSIAVLKALSNGARYRDIWGYWLFILLITGLSWLFNWEYNITFQTSTFQM